jgi:hypothetical protein
MERAVKALLKILAGGTVLFIAVAVVQEWSLFGKAWFGTPETEAAMPDGEKKAASDTVYRMLKVMEHLYASGGDPRFAERMPVSKAVLEEIQADLEYLRRNHRRQEMSLDRLEVTGIEAPAANRVQIETRETWSIRIAWADEEAIADGGHQRRVYGTYRLTRGDRGWRVEGWDPSVPWRPAERAGGPE